jgi:NAD-dependent dihydropyrimidine dehydrogenase PreA subunit
MTDTIFAVPEPAVFSPITIDEQLCIACNLCVLVCPADLFLPNSKKSMAPIVMYAGECWYEGSCVDACPVPGAIELKGLLVNRVQWKLAGPRA